MLYIYFKYCLNLMILGTYCVLHSWKNNTENVKIKYQVECNEARALHSCLEDKKTIVKILLFTDL